MRENSWRYFTEDYSKCCPPFCKTTQKNALYALAIYWRYWNHCIKSKLFDRYMNFTLIYRWTGIIVTPSINYPFFKLHICTFPYKSVASFMYKSSIIQCRFNPVPLLIEGWIKPSCRWKLVLSILTGICKVASYRLHHSSFEQAGSVRSTQMNIFRLVSLQVCLHQ